VDAQGKIGASAPAKVVRRVWPLAPLAPLIVMIAGLMMAVGLVVSGVAELRRTSDAEAHARADTLALVLAARVRSVALEDRAALLERAARGAAIELLLVEQDGAVVVDRTESTPASDEILRMLVAGDGETRAARGRSAFAARPLPPPLEHLSLVAITPAPVTPRGAVDLARAVAVLTVVLLGLAAIVSFTFVRAARDDVAYATKRVLAMAHTEAVPTGEPIPIRTLDQVGALTASFNVLVERFAAAERIYRADLMQAAATDAELSEFLAGLSHELRTPLNAILGFAHVLESEVDGPLPDDAKENLAVIRTSGEHLRQLVDDVLDLSALEGGQLVLSLRDTDIRQVVDEVVAEVSHAAAQKGLDVGVEGDDVAIAHVDKRRVRQIITNLVQNAVKFTPRGSVLVKVRQTDTGVELRVVDTGPGIPEMERGAIFQEYRQAGPDRQRRAGTGLGLAIVRRLVRLHRGTIALGSEVGRGSTFVIKLPRTPPPAVAEAT
jgi:signal transduction histidine kinase